MRAIPWWSLLLLWCVFRGGVAVAAEGDASVPDHGWALTREELAAIEPGTWPVLSTELAFWHHAPHQDPDGFWRLSAELPAVPAVAAEDQTIAITALRLLEYLGAGYDHRRPSQYRGLLQRAVAALLGARDEAGRFAEDVGAHALALWALAKCYHTAEGEALVEPLRAGFAALLADARRDEHGRLRGWPGTDFDGLGTQQSAWAVMAWKTLEDARIETGLARDELSAALTAMAERVCADHALVDRADELAVALATLDREDPRVEQLLANALRRMVELEEAGEMDMLLAFQAGLAAFRVGGEYWRWTSGVLLSWYDRGARRGLDLGRPGDWIHPQHRAGGADAAFAVLGLELFYRYPVDSRSRSIPRPAVDLDLLERLARLEGPRPVLLLAIIENELERLRMDFPELVEDDLARMMALLGRFEAETAQVRERFGPEVVRDWLAHRLFQDRLAQGRLLHAPSDLPPWLGPILAFYADYGDDSLATELQEAIVAAQEAGTFDPTSLLAAYAESWGRGRVLLLRLLIAAEAAGADLNGLDPLAVLDELEAEVEAAETTD